MIDVAEAARAQYDKAVGGGPARSAVSKLSLPRKIKAAELYDDEAQQAPNEARRVVFFISVHVAKSAAGKILCFLNHCCLLAINTVFLLTVYYTATEKHMDFKRYQIISPHLREQQGQTAPLI